MKKYFAFLLLFLLMVPINADALVGDVSISCDSEQVVEGDKVTCLISGNNFSDYVSSFHTELELDDNWKISDFKLGTGWQGSGSGGLVDLYTDINKNGKVDFITFVLVSKNVSTNVTSEILLKNTKVGDPNFFEYDINSKSQKLTIVVSDEEEVDDDTQDDGEDDQGDEKSEDENKLIVYFGYFVIGGSVLIALIICIKDFLKAKKVSHEEN